MDQAITLQLTVPAGKLFEAAAVVAAACAELTKFGASLVEVAANTASAATPRPYRYRSPATRAAASAKKKAYWANLSPEQRAAIIKRRRLGALRASNGHAA